MHLFRPQLSALVLVTQLASLASAQTGAPPSVPPLSNPTDPTRPAPLNPPIPAPVPPPVPLDIPARPDLEPPSVSPELEAARFFVDRIDVIGNTIFDDDIAALVQPLEGRFA